MATVGNVDVKFSAKGLAQVQAQTNKAAGAMGGMAGKADQARAGLAAMAKAAAALTAAAAASAAAMVKLADMAGQFEFAIADAGAKSKATAEDLDVLTQAAIRAGIETRFSPKAAAEGLAVLSSKGLDAAEATGVLTSALGLAAAGQITVADASDAVVGVLKVYQHEIGDAAMLTDKLVAVTNSSSFQASEFATALGKATSKSKALGQGLDQTLVAMAFLRNATIDASSAQTMYNRAITNLAAGNAKQKKALKDLGISYYDQHGQVRDVNLVIAEMSEKMAGLTPKMANQAKAAVFGSRSIAFFDAVASASVKTQVKGRTVMLKGAAAIREMTRRVRESSGASAEYQARLKDTFQGSKTFLAGSAETLAIIAGMPFAEIFKPMVETVTNGLNRIIGVLVSMPAGMKKAGAGMVIGLTGVVAAVGGVLGLIVTLGATVKLLGPMLAAGLGALPAVFGAIKVALAGLLSVMLPIIVIIGTIALVVGALYEANHRTLGALSDIWRGAMDYISGIIETVTDFMSRAWNAVMTFIFDATKSGFDSVLKVMNKATNLIMKSIGKIVDLYGEFLFALGREEEAAALRGLRDDLLNFDADWGANLKLMNEEWIKPSIRQLGYYGDALVTTGASIAGDFTGALGDGLELGVTGLKRMLGFSMEEVGEEVSKGLASGLKLPAITMPKVKTPKVPGAGGGGGADSEFMDDYARRMRKQNQEERQRRRDQREQESRDKLSGGIGAFQAGMQGNLGGLVTGIAAAVGSAFGPTGQMIASFADTLIGASQEGKVFKEILSEMFGVLAESLGPVINMFSTLFVELRPLFSLLGIIVEAFGVLAPVVRIVAAAMGLVGAIVINLEIALRAMWMGLLTLIDMIPGIDYSTELEELEAAQRSAMAERDDLLRRLTFQENFEEQRARRDRELAAATREATQAMLNVPAGYKVARARFGAEAPVMDDFVMRPGQPPVSFSPNDTIVGTKNGASGGTTIVIERLELSASNPSAFLTRLLSMVNSDNLRGGMALGGAYQGRP